jgi:hypothetical protein
VEVTYRLSFESATASGVEIVNVFHVLADTAGPGDTDFLAYLADAARDDLRSSYLIMLAASSTLHRLRISTEPDPTVPGDPVFGTERTWDLAGGGGTPTEFAPHELGIVLSMRTAILGRSFRGHLFLPPLSNANDIDGEQVDPGSTYYGAALGWRDDLQTWVAPWSSGSPPPADTNPRLVVYSRTRRQRAEFPFSNDVTSLGVTRRLHWLRSRAT